MNRIPFQVGDIVVMHSNSKYTAIKTRVHKIKRVMQRFVELDNGYKFLPDGQMYPKSRDIWDKGPYIEHATDELIEQANRELIIYFIGRRWDISKTPTKTLQRVYKIIKKEPTKKLD